eukprot:CAMPEP_0185706328 /NCGR_PEP_ID=MMETSP1164-20130828/21703_1 /TAXON_ID=1104430 /ORGANISM="Chrysoreinhardia sp, Strain CCMP2950" /LENGTH=329 /DNA_ID=CAMNT_0028373731 /DNA_START=89 /DNA_END=1075 /DNA_ORIENTATION=-
MNKVDLFGAAVFATSSTITAVNSSFDRNTAAYDGNLMFLVQSSTAQLSDVFIREHDVENGTSLIRCEGTATIYAARWEVYNLESMTQRFDMDDSCVLFMYQVNNNGTLRAALWNMIGNTGAIQLYYWTYPCRAGQWSSDGLEHGNNNGTYVDVTGRTIDENDPTCDHIEGSLTLPDCPASCQTCPAGTYANFTLSRYKLVGETSCFVCPIGRFLEDDGTDNRWWLHDGPDDCVMCPPGRFAGITGAGTCAMCSPGTFARDSGSSVCDVAEPGYVAASAGASEQQPCSPGSFSVGGTDAVSCQSCSLGRFQPHAAQTLCLLASPGFFVGV